jgi:hypothetical protein
MTPDEAAAIYARMSRDYVRVAELIGAAEPDFTVLAQVIAGLDAECASLSPAEVSPLAGDDADRLAKAARDCDAQRLQTLAVLRAAQQAMTNAAADDARASRVAQAYRSTEGPNDGRFVDHRR